MTNAQDTVLTAAKELFTDQDVTAVDRWVASDYKQHSSLAPDGPGGCALLSKTCRTASGTKAHALSPTGTWWRSTARTTVLVLTPWWPLTCSAWQTASSPSTGTP